MTKNCRKCGSEVQDDAKFCPNCGYDFDSFNKGGNSESKFNFSMLFVILIISILIIGSIFILTSGFGGDNKPQEDNVDHVILTIKEVNGYDVISGKTSYTLYTEALFDKVPSDMNGYNIKTSSLFHERNVNI